MWNKIKAFFYTIIAGVVGIIAFFLVTILVWVVLGNKEGGLLNTVGIILLVILTIASLRSAITHARNMKSSEDLGMFALLGAGGLYTIYDCFTRWGLYPEITEWISRFEAIAIIVLLLAMISAFLSKRIPADSY